MHSLRKMVVLMALAAVSLSGKVAFAQQEVAPDFFDGSAAKAQKAAPVNHHQKNAHAVVAKKGSAKHHRAHAHAFA